MSFFLLKSILASLFLISAFVAALSMLIMMGKAEKKIDPRILRTIHKISGRLFLILLLILFFLGMRYWAKIGDQASVRAVFHAVLALGLTFVFLLKLAIVKFLKQFLRFAPGLGMMVFGLAFVVFAISAGFMTLKTLDSGPPPSDEIRTETSFAHESVENGAVLFNSNCLSCHQADSEEKKIGPGLKDLFHKEKLPHSGLPPTIENIKRQLIRPALTMPSFTNLTDQERADLVAYLKTL